MSRRLSSLDLCDIHGITYRQLDYWIRRGWVTSREGLSPGTGCQRTFNDDEAAVLARMAQLVNAGFRAEVAAGIARESAGRLVVDVSERVRLLFDVPSHLPVPVEAVTV